MPYDEDENQYEIMPIHTINEMKKEIESLKKQYLNKGVSVSIDTLNNNIKDLLDIFREATREMREEQKTVDESKKKIDEVSSNVNELFDQNAKIAEAIITVHDLTREMKEMMDEMAKKGAKPELATPMPYVPPIPANMPPLPAVAAEPEMPVAPPLVPRPPQPPQQLGRPLPGTMPPPKMPPPPQPPPQRPMPGSEDIGFLPPTPPPRRARAPPPPLGIPLPKKKKKGLFV
ncbi:MAG: methyl-accepting chemotaxis protein [Nanoarchaeota archaeon]|nr:methyl-accepting chemotaxis protein [Nanoarchaeota archaeon]